MPAHSSRCFDGSSQATQILSQSTNVLETLTPAASGETDRHYSRSLACIRIWPAGPLASDPSKLKESNRLSESAAVRIGEGANAIKDGFQALNCAAAVIAALRDSQQEIPFSKTRKV